MKIELVELKSAQEAPKKQQPPKPQPGGFDKHIKHEAEHREYIYLDSEDKYIDRTSGNLLSRGSINTLLPDVVIGKDLQTGKDVKINAADYIAHRHTVSAMTWVPGYPEYLSNTMYVSGERRHTPGRHTYNTYRPREFAPAAIDKAPDPGLWLSHLGELFPVDVQEHLLNWFAHRVQNPGDKINHSIVLGGRQGCGKDTLLQPVINAVGSWNSSEIEPGHLLEGFNGWHKSVILRISEARDMGFSRYQFYEKTKTLMAAPPDQVQVNEKYRKPYTIPNVSGVIITTNHKTGLYLPADDRRHFVAWTNKAKEDFYQGYFEALWDFYDNGGYAAVYKYLYERDISRWNPKAPPPITEAWQAMVDSGSDPADMEMADALEAIGNPEAVYLSLLTDPGEKRIDESLKDYLKDRRNARAIPYRLEAAGYTQVRNRDATDGRWRIDSKKHVVYAKSDLSERERIDAARYLCRPF